MVDAYNTIELRFKIELQKETFMLRDTVGSYLILTV